jgi:hypothetical protein
VTQENARTVANVAIAAAGVAAAYVVMTTPPLRRLAMQAVRLWLGASVPAYLVDTTRQAWLESESAQPDIMAG